MSRTNVKVSAETWRELNARKMPGDTFDDVIQRMLDDVEDDQVSSQPADAD